MQRDFGLSDFPAEVGVPLERQVFHAIAVVRGSEAKGMPIQVEELLAAEHPFIQLHQNQVSDDRDLTNGLAGLLALLRIGAVGRQKAD